jgi:hypothetical protein
LIWISDFFWLLVFLPALLILQRKLHREIQSVFLLLTRRIDITIVLFSILFFPGVVLHEFSHWFMAKLLGVRTGHLSLFPRQIEDGRLRLGYVETARTDLFRDALIGAAPLLAGGIVIAIFGWKYLGLSQIWDILLKDGWINMGEVLLVTIQQPDFWLWFYLIFTVSSTMFPSSTDWRAWPPLILVILLLFVLVLVAGAGPWLVENLTPVLNAFMESVVVVLGISLGIHVVLFIPFYLSRVMVSRITGLKVV